MWTFHKYSGISFYGSSLKDHYFDVAALFGLILWPNKNISVFRVTRPSLNLLVKPYLEFFQVFWKKI